MMHNTIINLRYLIRFYEFLVTDSRVSVVLLLLARGRRRGGRVAAKHGRELQVRVQIVLLQLVVLVVLEQRVVLEPAGRIHRRSRR